MNRIFSNVSTGQFCMANISAAIVGMTATMTLKDWAQIAAGFATAVWFLVQTYLAIRNRDRK